MDYVPYTQEELRRMLATIGVESFEELLRMVPEELQQRSLEVPSGLAETQVIQLCESLAKQNRSLGEQSCFLGAGAYRHLIPVAVDAIAARGEWLTPYTPYQAEASQGTLQAIYEFQSMVAELFQVEVANASLYDGASSAAEGVLLAMNATSRKRVLVSEAVHPHVRQTIATYLIGSEATLQEVPSLNGLTDLEALTQALNEDVACVLMQQPNFFGCLEPMLAASQAAHRAGALFISSAYPISLGLLQPPGTYEADIAVAEGRCLGSPVAYGGPGLGLFATTSELMRRIPGRLAGCTEDAAGKRGYTLTLQTREQHIRRERATSNICTNEGWLTLRATLFLSLMGPAGLKEMAKQNFDKAHYARERLCAIPWIRAAFDQPFFNEFALRFDKSVDTKHVARALEKEGIVGGLPLKKWYPQLDDVSLWCVTECLSREQIDQLVETLQKVN